MKLPWHKSTPTIQTVALTRARTPGVEWIEWVGLLLDRSPSMDATDYPPSRLEAAKQAALAFYNEKYGIDPRDRVAVLQFDGGCQTVAGFGAPAADVWQRVAGIRAGNATAIGRAMEHGIRLLSQEAPADSTRRLVILSDGDTNAGVDPRRLIDRCQREGIMVDAVGIGSPQSRDYRAGEVLLRELAARTGGLFVHCPDVVTLIAHYRQLAQKKRHSSIVTVGRT